MTCCRSYGSGCRSCFVRVALLAEEQQIRSSGDPSLSAEPTCMKGLLNMAGMSVGGWIGWAIGAPISIFTAFMVSIVGSGLGLYYTQRWVKRLLP